MSTQNTSSSSSIDINPREVANRRRRDSLDLLFESSSSALALAAAGSSAACGGNDDDTPPAANAPSPTPAVFAFGVASVKLAVFSCALYSEGYFHTHDAAARSDALCALHLGDYIHPARLESILQAAGDALG